MNKNELLRRIDARVDDTVGRAKTERAIIESLPTDVTVARTYVSINHVKYSSNARGCVEFDAQTFEDAVKLYNHPSLRPTEIVKVSMEKRNGPTTISFYPEATANRAWATKGKVEAVMPILFQVMPEPGPLKGHHAKVYLEWFSYLGQKEEGLPVNIRVVVGQHSCEYVDDRLHLRNGNGAAHSWRVQGLPDGRIRSIKYTGENGPPYVTVWWTPDEINDPDTWLLDVLEFSGPSVA